jgi:4,5-dihydroxyphthalate decarboxylase
MARRQMTLATQYFDRTAAFATGAVTIPDVHVVHVPPPVSVEGLIAGIFDAAEMPLARYVFLRDRGEPYVAIPVFPDRIFIQQYVYTRPDAGIRGLTDLRGRRVVVPQYFITASLWHRGMLHQEHGISPHEIEWVTTGPERDPRMRVPDRVKVTHVPGPHLGVERLLDGTGDCLMTEGTPVVSAEDQPRLVRLHQDVASLQRDYYRRTGVHTIVHIVVVRRHALDQRPELAEELCAAYDEAKALAYRRLQNERFTSLPLMRSYLDETLGLFGGDPWSYGFQRNRAELDRLLEYAHVQGLTDRRLRPDELFDERARGFRFQATMQDGANPGT